MFKRNNTNCIGYVGDHYPCESLMCVGKNETGEAYSKVVPTDAKEVKINKIGGKTVNWNQQVWNSDFASYDGWTYNAGVLGISNNEASYELLVLSTNSYSSRIVSTKTTTVGGHKYFIQIEVYAPHDNVIYARGSDPILLGAPTPNKWSTLSAIGAFSANSSAMWFCINQTSTNYSIGELVKFRKARIIDLTNTFGAGNEPTTTTDPRIEWIKRYAELHPEYDDGELISALVENIKSVGVNLYPYDYIHKYNYSKDYKTYNPDNAFELKAGNYHFEVSNATGGKYIQYFDNEYNQYDAQEITDFSSSIWDGKATYIQGSADITIKKDCIATICLNGELDITLQVCSASLPTEIKETYHPYSEHNFSIPQAVQDLEGYGESNGEVSNEVNLDTMIYTEYGHYNNGEWVELAEPIEIDISQYFNGNSLQVEQGGSLTFENDNLLSVPSEVTYNVIKKVDGYTLATKGKSFTSKYKAKMPSAIFKGKTEVIGGELKSNNSKYQLGDKTVDLSDIDLQGVGTAQDTYDSQSGKLDRKCATRPYQSGDESDTEVRTDGTTTVYKLATPTTEYITPQPIDQLYGSNQITKIEGDIDGEVETKIYEHEVA